MWWGGWGSEGSSRIGMCWVVGKWWTHPTQPPFHTLNKSSTPPSHSPNHPLPPYPTPPSIPTLHHHTKPTHTTHITHHHLMHPTTAPNTQPILPYLPHPYHKSTYPHPIPTYPKVTRPNLTYPPQFHPTPATLTHPSIIPRTPPHHTLFNPPKSHRNPHTPNTILPNPYPTPSSHPATPHLPSTTTPLRSR